MTTVFYDSIADEAAFKRNIRMECIIAGYEVVDFDLSGHDGRPYVTFAKKPERKPAQPKERFF